MTDILSETRAARAALLAECENYLVKQRGLSPRTIYHTLRFANRFLDHRFGEATMNLPDLRPDRHLRRMMDEKVGAEVTEQPATIKGGPWRTALL